jgi:hypothetical protein
MRATETEFGKFAVPVENMMLRDLTRYFPPASALEHELDIAYLWKIDWRDSERSKSLLQLVDHRDQIVQRHLCCSDYQNLKRAGGKS